MTELCFEDDDLGPRLDAMGEEARHALPFGVIGLDAAGRVRFYSATEARQSGSAPRNYVGLHFFESVAPCMDTPELRGRIERARAQGRLDLEVGHTGDFSDPTRFFRIRAVAAADGGLWLALLR